MRIELDTDLTDKVALMVAPHVGRLAELAALGAAQAAPRVKVWQTMHDERVRPWHVSAHGQECPENLRFALDQSPRTYRQNTPPVAVQWGVRYDPANSEYLREPRDPTAHWTQKDWCVPADTTLEADGCRASYRRWYQGPLVTVHTAAGNKLAATPNHPVLIDGIWRPIGSALPGEHVLSRQPRVPISPPGRTRPHVDHPPATFGEVHGAASQRLVAERVAGRSVDFHGDGSDGEVEVVRADRPLATHLAKGLQGERQLILALANVAAEALLRPRLGSPLAVRDIPATSGRVGRSRELRNLARRELREPNPVRVADASHLDTRSFEPAPDDVAGHPERVRDGLLALPVDVAADEVVHVEVDPSWMGFVHNVTTGPGWYLANSIVSHNCRCFMDFTDTLARSIGRGQVIVAGTDVTCEVATRFPRAAESEFGTADDIPSLFMTVGGGSARL